MATCSGGWLGVVSLSCWLTTANGLSRLIGVVSGALAQIVTRFSTLEACHNIGAWSSISSGATIDLGGACCWLGRGASKDGLGVNLGGKAVFGIQTRRFWDPEPDEEPKSRECLRAAS